jgi:hypothetical protein
MPDDAPVDNSAVKTEGDLVPQEKSQETTKEKVAEQETVSLAEAQMILEKLEGVVIKLGRVLFKVTYINKGQKRFTAQAINIK